MVDYSPYRPRYHHIDCYRVFWMVSISEKKKEKPIVIVSPV